MLRREILCINDHVSDLSEAQTERLLGLLPDWRRQAALRFKHVEGRRNCAVGYVELLRGLRLLYGIDEKPTFEPGEHGKPFLAGHPDIHFSISHCKVAVGCLVAGCPCGLDIERIRPARESLVRYTMNPQETEAILADSFPDIAFTRLWTQKEAVLKLWGTGITDDLHHVLEPGKLQGIELHTIVNPLLGYVVTKAVRLPL